MLQYNAVHEALNVELTDVPLFHGEKIYTVSNFGKKQLKLKMLSLVQLVLGKENSTSVLEKTHHMVVELQAQPGDKTLSTSVDDTAQQYLPYRYTPFQAESVG